MTSVLKSWQQHSTVGQNKWHLFNLVTAKNHLQLYRRISSYTYSKWSTLVISIIYIHQMAPFSGKSCLFSCVYGFQKVLTRWFILAHRLGERKRCTNDTEDEWHFEESVLSDVEDLLDPADDGIPVPLTSCQLHTDKWAEMQSRQAGSPNHIQLQNCKYKWN